MTPGRYSSEFWLAVVMIICDAVGAIFNLIPHEQAGVLATASVAAYNLSRGLAKMRGVRPDQAIPGSSGVTLTEPPPIRGVIVPPAPPLPPASA